MKLKINSLVREVLTDREQNRITGGSCSDGNSSGGSNNPSSSGFQCLCGCHGPSSTHDNGCANRKGHIIPPTGGAQF